MGGVELQFHSFLASELAADEWLDSRPGCFDAEGKNPDANSIGDCVRLRVRMLWIFPYREFFVVYLTMLSVAQTVVSNDSE
jgi:hypothetical protein